MRPDLKRLKGSLDSSRTSTVDETAAGSSGSAVSAVMQTAPTKSKSGPSSALLVACTVVALVAGVYVGKLLFTKGPSPPSVYRQLTFRRGSIRSARFSPDGT